MNTNDFNRTATTMFGIIMLAMALVIIFAVVYVMRGFATPLTVEQVIADGHTIVAGAVNAVHIITAVALH